MLFNTLLIFEFKLRAFTFSLAKLLASDKLSLSSSSIFFTYTESIISKASDFNLTNVSFGIDNKNLQALSSKVIPSIFLSSTIFSFSSNSVALKLINFSNNVFILFSAAIFTSAFNVYCLSTLDKASFNFSSEACSSTVSLWATISSLAISPSCNSYLVGATAVINKK